MAEDFIYQFQLLKQLKLYELQMIWLVTVQGNEMHIIAANRNLQIVRQQIRKIRYQLDCITDTGHIMPPNFPLITKIIGKYLHCHVYKCPQMLVVSDYLSIQHLHT